MLFDEIFLLQIQPMYAKIGLAQSKSVNPDKTAPGEQSDKGLHSLPFHHFRDQT